VARLEPQLQLAVVEEGVGDLLATCPELGNAMLGLLRADGHDLYLVHAGLQNSSWRALRPAPQGADRNKESAGGSIGLLLVFGRRVGRQGLRRGLEDQAGQSLGMRNWKRVRCAHDPHGTPRTSTRGHEVLQGVELAVATSD
jgi:hypothetical protein